MEEKKEVIKLDKFNRAVIRQYNRYRDERISKARDAMKNEALRKILVAEVQTMLHKGMENAVRNAFGTQSEEMRLKANLAKLGEKIYSRFPEGAKAKFPIDVVIMSIEVLLVDAGFNVSIQSHELNWKLDLKSKDESDPTPAAESKPVEAPTAPPQVEKVDPFEEESGEDLSGENDEGQEEGGEE